MVVHDSDDQGTTDEVSISEGEAFFRHKSSFSAFRRFEISSLAVLYLI